MPRPLSTLKAVLLLLVALTTVAAFQPSRLSRHSDSTVLASLDKKAPKEQDKKKPFVFLWGRPQIDWVTGKPMEENSGAKMDWLGKKNPKQEK